MQHDDKTTAEARACVAPELTRLVASEAEIGPAIAGPDFERVS